MSWFPPWESGTEICGLREEAARNSGRAALNHSDILVLFPWPQGTSLKKIRTVYDVNFTNRTIEEALQLVHERAAATVKPKGRADEQEEDVAPPKKRVRSEPLQVVFDVATRPAGLLA